jgi:bacterioferritin-associated ferredoxin
MFVCNCNGINQRAMSAAVDQVMGTGVPSVDAVYDACGVQPKCGRCKTDIARMIDAAQPSCGGALAAE